MHKYQPLIPKAERYTLWQRCEDTTLELLKIFLETGHKKAEERRESLCLLSTQLDLLKVFVRLAKEIHILTG